MLTVNVFLEADIINHAMQQPGTVSQSNTEAENFCRRFSFGMYEVQAMEGMCPINREILVKMKFY